MVALWVAPVARRHGVGRELALDVLGRHRGPWAIPFQDGSEAAALFAERRGPSLRPRRMDTGAPPCPGQADCARGPLIIAASG